MKKQNRPNYYRVKVAVRPLPKAGEEFDPEVDNRFEAELECVDLIRALNFNFFLGSALKYLFRLGKKEDRRKDDLLKVQTFCGLQIEDEENS